MLKVRPMSNKIIFVVIACFFVTACGASKKVVRSAKPLTSPVVVKVINSKKFIPEGKLLIVPFSAGEDVPATDDLSRFALRIVKGLSDGLGQNKTFVVLNADNSSEAQLTLRGRIVQQRQPRQGMPFFKKDGKKILAVAGELLDSVSGETILYFSLIQAAITPTDSFDDVAQALGTNLAQGLCDAVTRK